MEKLIKGIIKFREKVSKCELDHFDKIAAQHKPDALFIACSDSRVVPNLFASTDPGDLFVVRNVGNIIPPAEDGGASSGDVSELAAIEFSVQNLKVKDIIVCGHSECGAMEFLLENKQPSSQEHLSKWVGYAKESLRLLKAKRDNFDKDLADVNVLSQINVLQQLENLKSYPLVKEKIKKGELELHGWWFDIATANVYIFNETSNKFEILEGS